MMASFAPRAMAQVTLTFQYTGAPFDVAACNSPRGAEVANIFGSPLPYFCAAGNVTAVATFNVPSLASAGFLFPTSFAAYALGQTTTTLDFYNETFLYQNNGMLDAYFDVLRDIYSGFFFGEGDVGTNYSSGAFGFSDSPGTWTLTSRQVAGTPPLQITTTGLPSAASGQPYPVPPQLPPKITATGGSGSGYNWSITSGSLPPGFTLSAEGGCGNACTDVFVRSTGTPAAPPASYNFTPQVTDSAGNLATQPLTLVALPCQLNFAIRPTAGPPNSLDGEATTMNAAFMPKKPNGLPMGLVNAANACGFPLGFNWQQDIDYQPISPFMPNLPPPQSVPSANLSPLNTLQAPPPYNDPPFGAYTYEKKPDGTVDDTFPFYFPTGDLTTSTLPCTGALAESPAPLAAANELGFADCPANKALLLYVGPVGGAYTSFTTNLVGVLPCPGGATNCGAGVPSAPLFTWTWISSFNGWTGGVPGGIAQTQSLFPLDPSSGTGGVTITSINGVQLPSPVSASQVTTTASGLAYSRVTQTFNGTVTLRNDSGSAISGPLQILFTGLTDGVTLANATGDLSGTPYMTITTLALASGQSITVSVQFKNPSNATINFTPAIYSGSIS